MKTVNILGYETSAAGLEGDVEEAWELILKGAVGNYVACSNPHSLVVASKDPVFERALKNASVLLPDGIGIILGAKILGRDLSQRVAGSEFFLELTKRADSAGGMRYFFLGSTDRVLQLITARLNREFPRVTVCGVFSPPFKTEFTDAENEEMLDKINKAAPHVLWVGMTAPKQEKWIFQNRDKLNVPLIGAIGAVFDFYAGTKKRAPQWACDIGLEWLPRLLREPRRLFTRNFVSTPLFLKMILSDWLRGSGRSRRKE